MRFGHKCRYAEKGKPARETCIRDDGYDPCGFCLLDCDKCNLDPCDGCDGMVPLEVPVSIPAKTGPVQDKPGGGA